MESTFEPEDYDDLDSVTDSYSERNSRNLIKEGNHEPRSREDLAEHPPSVESDEINGNIRIRFVIDNPVKLTITPSMENRTLWLIPIDDGSLEIVSCGPQLTGSTHQSEQVTVQGGKKIRSSCHCYGTTDR